MSDERQAFEQLHAIPSGVEWCEKRHIYIHKNYSGLVLHPINESWKAFCEGALWQASRQALEGEPVAEVAQVGGSPVVFWDKSLLVGTKLYTHPASAEVERLQARVAELYDLIKYAQVDSGVCMCGDDIKDHNQSSGHMPLDIWDHAVEQINKEGSSEAFILRKQAEAVQASRQEGEPIGFLQSSGVSQLSGGHPAKLYPIGATPSPFESSTLVYTHPASADVPDGWTFTRESDGRIVINADGLGFYVARLEADRIAEILLYALANDLLNDGTSKADEVSDFNAEIRTVRDICDEYQNYLVFVSRGKSEPYLHVPDDVNEDVLAEAIKRLNATPTKAKSVAEDSDYIDALQGTFDIIQADANTERNYEALCRVGATLKELKAKQEQDK